MKKFEVQELPSDQGNAKETKEQKTATQSDLHKLCKALLERILRPTDLYYTPEYRAKLYAKHSLDAKTNQSQTKSPHKTETKKENKITKEYVEKLIQSINAGSEQKNSDEKQLIECLKILHDCGLLVEKNVAKISTLLQEVYVGILHDHLLYFKNNFDQDCLDVLCKHPKFAYFYGGTGEIYSFARRLLKNIQVPYDRNVGEHIIDCYKFLQENPIFCSKFLKAALQNIHLFTQLSSLIGYHKNWWCEDFTNFCLARLIKESLDWLPVLAKLRHMVKQRRQGNLLSTLNLSEVLQHAEKWSLQEAEAFAEGLSLCQLIPEESRKLVEAKILNNPKFARNPVAAFFALFPTEDIENYERVVSLPVCSYVLALSLEELKIESNSEALDSLENITALKLQILQEAKENKDPLRIPRQLNFLKQKGLLNQYLFSSVVKNTIPQSLFLFLSDVKLNFLQRNYISLLIEQGISDFKAFMFPSNDVCYLTVWLAREHKIAWPHIKEFVARNHNADFDIIIFKGTFALLIKNMPPKNALEFLSRKTDAEIDDIFRAEYAKISSKSSKNTGQNNSSDSINDAKEIKVTKDAKETAVNQDVFSFGKVLLEMLQGDREIQTPAARTKLLTDIFLDAKAESRNEVKITSKAIEAKPQVTAKTEDSKASENEDIILDSLIKKDPNLQSFLELFKELGLLEKNKRKIIFLLKNSADLNFKLLSRLRIRDQKFFDIFYRENNFICFLYSKTAKFTDLNVFLTVQFISKIKKRFEKVFFNDCLLDFHDFMNFDPILYARFVEEARRDLNLVFALGNCNDVIPCNKEQKSKYSFPKKFIEFYHEKINENFAWLYFFSEMFNLFNDSFDKHQQIFEKISDKLFDLNQALLICELIKEHRQSFDKKDLIQFAVNLLEYPQHIQEVSGAIRFLAKTNCSERVVPDSANFIIYYREYCLTAPSVASALAVIMVRLRDMAETMPPKEAREIKCFETFEKAKAQLLACPRNVKEHLKDLIKLLNLLESHKILNRKILDYILNPDHTNLIPDIYAMAQKFIKNQTQEHKDAKESKPGNVSQEFFQFMGEHFRMALVQAPPCNSTAGIASPIAEYLVACSFVCQTPSETGSGSNPNTGQTAGASPTNQP